LRSRRCDASGFGSGTLADCGTAAGVGTSAAKEGAGVALRSAGGAGRAGAGLADLSLDKNPQTAKPKAKTRRATANHSKGTREAPSPVSSSGTESTAAKGVSSDPPEFGEWDGSGGSQLILGNRKAFIHPHRAGVSFDEALVKNSTGKLVEISFLNGHQEPSTDFGGQGNLIQRDLRRSLSRFNRSPMVSKPYLLWAAFRRVVPLWGPPEDKTHEKTTAEDKYMLIALWRDQLFGMTENRHAKRTGIHRGFAAS